MPGFVDRRIYPVTGSALATARRLAQGHLRGRRATLYVSSSPGGEANARVVAEQLARLGIEVDVRSFGSDVFVIRLGLPSEPYDMAIVSWSQDWPDPVEFVEPILHSRSIPTGVLSPLRWNVSHFSSARLDKRIDAAARLSGKPRARAFAQLEADVLRKDAPILPLYYVNDILFSSSHVACLTYSAAFTIDYAALCRR